MRHWWRSDRSPPAARSTEAKLRGPTPAGGTIVNSPLSGQPRSAAQRVGRLVADRPVDGEAAGLLVGGDDSGHLGVHASVGSIHRPVRWINARRIVCSSALGSASGAGSAGSSAALSQTLSHR